jgi:uncharacterized cupredoxin-like copper-binding protein
MFLSQRRMPIMITVLLSLSILLAACGGSSSKTVDVQVTLSDFKIQSSLTDFQSGVAYHFTIKNDGSVAHEFRIIPPMSSQSTQEQITSATLAYVDQSQLQPGQTATLDYTFTQAYPAGQLEFACHLPGHYDAGMHLGITVK